MSGDKVSIPRSLFKGALILGAETLRTGKAVTDTQNIMFASGCAVASYVAPMIVNTVQPMVFSGQVTYLEDQVIEAVAGVGVVYIYETQILKEQFAFPTSYSQLSNAGSASATTAFRVAEYVAVQVAADMIIQYIEEMLPISKSFFEMG